MECSTKDKLEHIVGSHKGKAGDSTAKKSATCPSAGAKSTGKTEWETARGGERGRRLPTVIPVPLRDAQQIGIWQVR